MKLFHISVEPNLQKFFVANYILECMDKSQHSENVDEALFDFLVQVMANLEQLSDMSKLLLFKCAFDAKFIRLCGYEISLFNCIGYWIYN